MSPLDTRLGQSLIDAGHIDLDQLHEALEYQKKIGTRLGTSLVHLGHLEEADLVAFLARHYGVPAINLDDPAIEGIEDAAVRLIPAEVARKYLVLPVAKNGSRVTLAMADPSNVFAIDDIRFRTGYRVEPAVASEAALRRAIDRRYGSSQAVVPHGSSSGPNGALGTIGVLGSGDEGFDGDLQVLDDEEEVDLDQLVDETEEAPVVKLVNVILTEAIKKNASDIHIEPYEKAYRVRYRIDGVLYEMMTPPLRLKEAITSRIKILARLDIAERRLPQDGRIKIKTRVGGRAKDLDYRVSVLPTLFGEKIVLRLLDKDNLMLDLTKLGFEPESLLKFEHAVLQPYGMVLVTGPTGSGKTNTLYSALQRVNTADVNIMTAEDPVEFNLAGINQVQMKESIGLNFAAALRSFLRQDPNIILVGEIRDFETAEVAIKAAMTGHLVLSTLHTNDAPSSINRLMNMGVEPFLVATSVHLVVAQRLVRRICSQCKEPFDAPPSVLTGIGFSEDEAAEVKLFKGRGCERCSQTGYKGRVGLYEVMELDDELRELVLSGGSSYEVRQKAIQKGMVTLRQSGLCKIRDGVTTVDEVVRETVGG